MFPPLQFFCPFTEAQQTFWIGSAVCYGESVVASAGTGFVWHGAAPVLCSQKPLLSPSATSPLPFKPNATANSERKYLLKQVGTKGQNMSK